MRLLLDSGTSDNVIKRCASKKLNITRYNKPKFWGSFGREIETSDTAKNVEFYMPEFSMSKIASLDFDMIEDEDGKNLPFDMVIETKGMSNLNMKLDFKDNIIIWEDIKLSMKPDGYFNLRKFNKLLVV